MEPDQINDEKKIKEMELTTASRVKEIKIVDDQSNQDALNFGMEIKRRIKNIEKFFEEPLKTLHAAHLKMSKNKKDALAPFEKMEREIKDMSLAYMDEQDKKRRQEQEAAEKEQRRIQAEERQRQIDEAAALGTPEEVKAIVDAPLPPPPAFIPPPAVEKPKGAATTTRWQFEIVDAKLITREFLMPDEKKLGAYATAMKDGAVVPGVRFYPKTDLSLRAS